MVRVIEGFEDFAVFADLARDLVMSSSGSAARLEIGLSLERVAGPGVTS